MRFGIDEGGYLEIILSDGQTVLTFAKSTATVSDDDWVLLMCEVSYDNGSQSTKLTTFINQTTSVVNTDPEVYFKEHWQSRATLAASYEWDGSEAITDIYKGYIYEFVINNSTPYNGSLSLILTTSCTSANVACSVCPALS